MLLYYYYCLFFFFKQKPAYEMRISDWSSDVCSSDLEAHQRIDRDDDPEHAVLQQLAQFESQQMAQHGSGRLCDGVVGGRGTPQLAEVHVLQVGRDGCEALARIVVAEHVDHRLAGDQSRRKHAVGGEMLVQRGLVDRLLPHSAVERSNRLARLAGQAQLALGDDRHARAQVGDVLDDMRGQEHHHLLTDLRSEAHTTELQSLM